MTRIQTVVIAALAAVSVPAAAAPGGPIGVLLPGPYICEMPGDAAGAAGHRVAAEGFTIVDARSYTVGAERGTYLLLGDALTMTSGPKRGQTYRRVSTSFLRRTQAGADTPLRCVRQNPNIL